MMRRMSTLYPLRLQPVYKDYPWGGDRIGRRYGRALAPGIYAESWEVADRPEGMSVVLNGSLAGRSLHDLVVSLGGELLGRRSRAAAFPLLIKLIDARDVLSVQVHPDNGSAALGSGEPKTEMWYVLEAAPGACVYCGLQPGVTREAFADALRSGAVDSCLVRIPVRAHDAIYVPGGRVHAIGAGCLMLECQQNSNTTFRLHDWGRVGADGRPRELHVEAALRVIRWTDQESPRVRPRVVETAGLNEIWEILGTPYFRMERFHLQEDWTLRRNPDSFRVLFVERGRVDLRHDGFADDVTEGTSLLIPAACADLAMRPLGGPASVIAMSAP